MKRRFAYELIVGIICLIAILLFGETGMIAFVLFAAHPFIGKKKADERENQLFNKVGNITAGATFLAAVVIFMCSDFEVNGHLIDEFWLGLVAAAFLMSHGMAGLIILRKV